MTDFWAQDAADPAHPEITSPAAPSFWTQDAADPAFPATATPAAKPSQKAAAVDTASLPIFEPNSGLSYDPANPSGPMRMFGGYAAGAVSPLAGATQLAAHAAQAVAPETMSPVAKFTDSVNNWLSKGSPEYEMGHTAGTYTAPALVAPALPLIGGAGLAGTASRIGAGAAAGAGFGATTAVDNPDDNFWGQKARQVGTGAVIGGALPAAGAAVRGLFPGASPAVQAMRDAGVEPTPGQALGGLPKLVEDWIGRIPIAGAPVQMGRQAAVEQFNRSAINEALAPIGETLAEKTPLGREAIAEMGSKVSDAYTDVIPRISPAPLDQQLYQDLSDIGAATNWLPKASRDQIASVIKTNVVDRLGPSNTLTGQAFKDAESKLGEIASNYRTSGDADQRAVGNAAMQVQASLRDWLMRTNPDEAPALSAANDAYARALRVQTAASRIGGGDPGVFTPEQLQAAVRQLDPSKLKGAFARGQALMQDFAEAGRSALSPPRGSAGHAQDIGAGIIGSQLIEHLAEHPFNPMTYAGAVAYPVLRGAYSNFGRGVVNNLLLSGASRVPFSVAPFAAQYGASRPGGLPLLPGEVPR